jgi:hypothetical protein
MPRALPEWKGGRICRDNIGAVTDEIGGMLFADCPARVMRGKNDPSSYRPTEELDAILLALENLGYRCYPEDINPPYSRIMRSRGRWHLDGSVREGRMQLRRHRATQESARVAMRRAKQDSNGNFVADKTAPIYRTTQEPGDRILFVAIGGRAVDGIIYPEEHIFSSLDPEQPRRCVRTVIDFTVACIPAETVIAS